MRQDCIALLPRVESLIIHFQTAEGDRDVGVMNPLSASRMVFDNSGPLRAANPHRYFTRRSCWAAAITSGASPGRRYARVSGYAIDAEG